MHIPGEVVFKYITDNKISITMGYSYMLYLRYYSTHVCKENGSASWLIPHTHSVLQKQE